MRRRQELVTFSKSELEQFDHEVCRGADVAGCDNDSARGRGASAGWHVCHFRRRLTPILLQRNTDDN